MTTTPSTSISSSYQRLGGSTPVITQTGGPGGGGPSLRAKKRELSAEESALEQLKAQQAVDRVRYATGISEMKKYMPVQYKQLQNKRAYDKDVAAIMSGKAPSKSSQAYFKNEMKGMQKLPWGGSSRPMWK
jgi:hypothetical protein